ncbi:MAG: hypothetical protein JWN70_5966 [Planctomycetaceae bacterium]|nr:hypothetical protein [Planctomycetaceae bacterium]
MALCDPSRVDMSMSFVSGGVVAPLLNHRLFSVTPPGSNCPGPHGTRLAWSLVGAGLWGGL